MSIDAIATNGTSAVAVRKAGSDYLLAVKANQPTLQRAGEAVRGHWTIENSLHWVLDVVLGDDQSRLRKGHGARTMAIVRHFAINPVRSASDPVRPEPLKP